MFDHPFDAQHAWLGVQYKTILTTDETGGAMSITDSLGPAGSGPPRHVHDDADESFVMLTGHADFWVQGEIRRLGPGESLFVPRGAEHTFRVTDDGPSRHLIILTPGGFEAFFAEMARGRFAIPNDIERIVEAGARHHLRFTGPPLDAGEV